LPTWIQPLDPLGYLPLSALAAALPLAVLLLLMGGLRKSGAVSAALGLASATFLAVAVWHFPWRLACLSLAFGCLYALWPIMWIVFASLWLYNLAIANGSFEQLRRWMATHASGDPHIQAILVAFCFGTLLEGTSGFGAPVAVSAFLLLGLGFSSRDAVTLSLIANTAPVAFGGLGIPIVALAAVTGLDQLKLSAMVGRQLPFLSLVLPAYLVWVCGGRKGLRKAWPAALAGGGSYALAQFLSSNYWGPYATGIVAALFSIACLVLLLRVWKPGGSVRSDPSRETQRSAPKVSGEHTIAHPGAPGLDRQPAAQALAAWAPWLILAGVMVAWSYFKLFQVAQRNVPVPYLHNAVFIALYRKLYTAVYQFQPLAAGTAALTATVVTALVFRNRPAVILRSGLTALKQLRLPALTVGLIVALAYLYNYSGMAYTLGAALAGLGKIFPLVSGYLGWVACFLSGSDTASNLLFGNLQVAVGRQIGVSPTLLAATNSSGGVIGKMISPQNIAVGVTTVGLIGHEGEILRRTFWHSLLLPLGLSALAFSQAYWLKGMVP
jgi:L-lactate transport